MSIWDDVKGLLGAVAPGLATAVGGPLAGMATRQITRYLLGDDRETDDPEVAIAALASATPEDLLKLKQADQDFTVQMRQLDIDLERLHASDRDSARQREVQTGSRMPAFIALAALAGFFGVLTAMIFVEIPPSAIQGVSIMLGTLGTMVGAIANYYFGSSSGSSQKNQMIERLAQGRGAPPVPPARPGG